MKMSTIKFAAVFLIPLLFIGCIWHTDDEPFIIEQSAFEPVTMTRVVLENSVATLPVQNIIKSGKIYIFDNFLFISEVNDGFHVFDYQNPLNPVPLIYLKAPGATDLAIRNNILYINQAVDLISMEFKMQTSTFELLHRNKNVFPQKISPDGFSAPINSDEIIVNWVPK